MLDNALTCETVAVSVDKQSTLGPSRTAAVVSTARARRVINVYGLGKVLASGVVVAGGQE